MRLIERGVQDKPPIVQFADKVGAYFLVAVSIAAACVFAFWCRRGMSLAIDHTVALLIVTCPCVLGLATPMTIAIAIGKLARRDILVKSGAAIEKLAGRGSLLLDKTGTITEGQLKLLDWTGDVSVQPLVAELERHSNHPVGRALHAAFPTATCVFAEEIIERGDGGITGTFDGRKILVGSPRFFAKSGISVDSELKAAIGASESSGATAVVVAIDGRAVAVASLGDQVRADSASAIASLRKLRWSPRILSGDAADVIASVAARVGITDASGPLSPEEKLERVERRESKKTTVMVGDGVNDAAALAAADVGIAVHGGTEASLAAADVYIAAPGLWPLVELIETSRLAMRTIRRNLLVSLGYNVLAGALAATGIMTPLIAAIIMPVSSATVMSLAVASIGRTRRSAGGRK
jgi:Cu2+-exporting ATPase